MSFRLCVHIIVLLHTGHCIIGFHQYNNVVYAYLLCSCTYSGKSVREKNIILQITRYRSPSTEQFNINVQMTVSLYYDKWLLEAFSDNNYCTVFIRFKLEHVAMVTGVIIFVKKSLSCVIFTITINYTKVTMCQKQAN